MLYLSLTHVLDKGLTLKHTATTDNNPIILTLATGELNIESEDIIGQIDFQAPDEGEGSNAQEVCAGIAAISEGDFLSDNNSTKLSFKTATNGPASEKMSLSSGGNLTVSGNLGVGGTLTYEDVTNIDAIGIITARAGINVTGGTIPYSFIWWNNSGNLGTGPSITPTTNGNYFCVVIDWKWMLLLFLSIHTCPFQCQLYIQGGRQYSRIYIGVEFINSNHILYMMLQKD